MKPMTTPYLHVIFCDDVRPEASGKMLYIGVYGGELIAPAFPLLLPKLAVVAYYAFPFGDQPDGGTSKAQSISLMLDGEELLELAQFGEAATPPPVEEGSRGHLMTFMMGMAPFQLPRPGRLRVMIKRDDGIELLSNSLICRLPNETEQMMQ